jgi:hypothetical protein
VTATAVEPAATPEPTITGPPEVLLIPLSGEVEEKLYRFVHQSQAPLGDVIASWLAAAPEDAPVPAESSGAVRAAVPASIAASVRAEAKRRGLQVAQVASARLASVAGRG